MIPPREFIKKIKPFDLLTEDEMEFIVTKIDVEAFEEGEIIFSGIPKKIYIVFSGSVGLYQNGELIEEFEKGDLFGLGIYENSKAVANSDTICFTIKKEYIDRIASENKFFREFFEKIVKRDYRGLASLFERKELSDALLMRVSDCITKKPVFCDAYTSIRDAAVKMELNGVGSIVVVKNDMTPVGIFTNRDLRKFVIHGLNKDEKVSAYMSSPVFSIEFDRPLFEAYQILTSKRINHLVVTRYGKLFGVISIKDIMAQFEPFTSISILHRKLGKATSIEEVKSINEKIFETIKNLAIKGMGFYELSLLISSFYDLLTEKVIDIVERNQSREFGKLPEFVWVHMGSSARKEQILATDQDNMIICEEDGERMRDFARKVNDSLEFVGIPKCSGGYMAMNWCMDIEEWKNRFRKWMNEFTPENIRLLTVFLDMRAIYGKKELLNELFSFINERVNAQVLRHLSNDATLLEPPKIGGIRGVNEIDLKKFGIYPIVNCTRVLALENKILEIANTRERLIKLVEMGILNEDFVKSILDSYELLQNLRLKNQVEGKGNVLKLRDLSRINQFALKDALRIVKDFEKFLKGRFFVERGI
ncbi:MAG: DUF294 nucleotidyltransferase-like domain-containing protein [Archaeoglobaceae archaeon]